MLDISIFNPETLDDIIDTLIAISLFSDQSEQDPYWEDPDFGSKLYTLVREKKTPQNLVLAEQYATDALEWLVDDGWLESLAVSAEYRDESTIVQISPVKKEVDLLRETIT
ncbi:MAG: phage GP46 family protein [Pseudobacteriovorax sp.]|nr:phage GP46 family protein [Pseudobacteriovorax sp.]